MTASFVHLNLHTEFSIVDGIVRIEQLMPMCAEKGLPAVALTDQSNLFALIKFYKAAIAAGIKPIIGVDVWLENPDEPRKPFKMILLARDQLGYQNILKIVSLSYTKGQHLGVPQVKVAWLQEMAGGIIVLSGAKNGDIGQALLSGKQEQAKKLLQFWLQLFPNSYYLELQRTGRAQEEEYLQAALNLAVDYNAPVVATNAVCFLGRQDFEAHEARVCIHDGYVLVDPERPRLYSEQQYLRSPAEMAKLFADIPEALANSVAIATRCNVELTLGKTFLPIFPVPSTTTPETFFAKAARDGLLQRLPTINIPATQDRDKVYEQYAKRLEYEIGVINQMGFASYFLIVADFISWSKKNGIPVGPGRGSGAGSLVAYALQITDLDPILHELLFERFLNPERVSLPDFDVDFCMDGRDRVIEYVMDHYGRDKVAQIITYGTMAARAVVRDVGRVLGQPYGFVDKLAKLIPFEIGISLERALEEEELLHQRYKQEEDVKTLIDLALKLEGLTRNAGKHAGGVVIAPSVLTDFTPLYCEADSEGVVTQLDKNDVETIGLVKFDFLGLRTLTIINWALQAINAKLAAKGEAAIDISQIPLDDAKTLALLCACQTTAVFQLESRGMKDLVKRLRPDSFSDIVALVALFRPGPLQSGMVEDFINRKHGRAAISYLHPKLANILSDTYGVILYQEQVMQIAQVLAGYSLGGADLLRRAMGKKKPEEMALQRAVFIEGAAKREIDKHLANTIFDLIEKFAGYGFNKSHSAAYALLTYQTAWLKAHYPAEFMAAVLSSDMDNTDKVVYFLSDCRKLNLTIIPPDINYSAYRFTVNENGAIVYGLGAIKGAGQSAIEALLESRNSEGPFKDLFDLCRRVDTRKVNKRVLEALICSGALDKIGPNRATMMNSLPIALKAAEQQGKAEASGQLDLFSCMFADEEVQGLEYAMVSEWQDEERLKNEKAVLGSYLAGHPIERFSSELEQFISTTIAELTAENKRTVLVAGFISNLKVITTKSGNRLAIITLEDNTGSVDVTMFAENYNTYRELLVADQLIIIEGEVGIDTFSDTHRIRATKAMSLDQARAIYARAIELRLSAEQISSNVMHELYQVLEAYRGGKCPVNIAYTNGDAAAKLALGDAWKVQPKSELTTKLQQKFGVDQIKVIYR